MFKNVVFFTKLLTLGSWNIYGPKLIRLILANFELVKCYLLYFSQVNKYNQIKAVFLFYLPGKKLQVARKNCFVERIFREVTLTHIWLNYSIISYCAIAIVPTIFFILYISTKSSKVKKYKQVFTTQLINTPICLFFQ